MGPEDRGTRFEAQYWDGRSSTPHTTHAWIVAQGVAVANDATTSDPAGASDAVEAQVWPFAELLLMRGGARGEPVQLERRAGRVQVLVVEAPGFLAELNAALPAGARLARTGGMRVGPLFLLSLVLLFVVVVFAGYRFLVPALADLAAERVPAEWEQRLAAPLLDDLAPEARRETNAVVRGPARALHARLALAAGGGAGASRLVVTRHDMVNAFAAPGGTVVVTTGLLRAMRSPDELAAVLAHELGHVHRRHSLRSMLRQLSLQVLLLVAAGDASALSSGVRAAGELGGLAYSREYEREADDLGVRLLAKQGIDAEALAAALESLARATPHGAELGFLSTHPSTADRLERLRRMRGPSPAMRASAVTPRQWLAMKAALGARERTSP